MVAMSCGTTCRRGRDACASGPHHVPRRARRCLRRHGGGSVHHDVVGRYCDPATGQFLSVDPLDDQTRQAYVYAADDPVQIKDCSGLEKCEGSKPTPAVVIYLIEDPHRLEWHLSITPYEEEHLGPIVTVWIALAGVNYYQINPPYSPHSEDVSYDFHGSLTSYTYLKSTKKRGGGILKRGDNVFLYWDFASVSRPGDIAWAYIDCFM